MLLERTLLTLKKIGNERLQLPLFYESPVSLRFEIGDPAQETYLPAGGIDPLYLRRAQWRTSYLFSQTAPFDTLLWVLYRTTETETPVEQLVSRFCALCRLPAPAEVYEQETTDADGDPLLRVFLLWDLEQTPADANALLHAILTADLRTDGFRELTSAVFFLDTTHHLLFHLYDDRGADILAASKDTLRPLYTSCQNRLLAYDLERMRATFSQP